MGDRFATIDMGRKVGDVVPFWEELGPHLTQCGMGRGLTPYTKWHRWHLDPSSHLATTDMGRTVRGLLRLIFWVGAGSPCNTMSPGPRPIPLY